MAVPTLVLLPHPPAAEATHPPALGPPAVVVAQHTVGPGLLQIDPDPGLSLVHRPNAAEHARTRAVPVAAAVAVAVALAAHTGLVAPLPGLSHRTKAVPSGTAATPDPFPDLSHHHVAAKALAKKIEATRDQFLDLHRLLVVDAMLHLLGRPLLNGGQSHGAEATRRHRLAADKRLVVM